MTAKFSIRKVFYTLIMLAPAIPAEALDASTFFKSNDLIFPDQIQNTGELTAAVNCGNNADSAVIAGISFSTETGNISSGGGDFENFSKYTASLSDPSDSDALNFISTGIRSGWNGFIEIALTDLEPGESYRLQAITGPSWSWCGQEMIFPVDEDLSGELDSTFLNGNTGATADLIGGIWRCRKEKETLRINFGDHDGSSGQLLGYVLHKVSSADTGLPLTMYSQQGLYGDSCEIGTFDIFSGSDIPNGLDNQAASILLKQGYQAVLGVNVNGTGGSRCYSAYDRDLIVNLPPELAGDVSFVRVLALNFLGKKGVCTGRDSPVNQQWFYNWGSGSSSSPEYEFVPMSWGKNGADEMSDIDYYISKPYVTHLLGFNEVDNCEDQSGQWYNMCDQTVSIQYFSNLQMAGLRLGSPSCRENAVFTWLPYFADLAEQQDIRMDFIGVHWYDWGSNPENNTNPNPANVFRRFKNYLNRVHTLYKKPIWITEFNANKFRQRPIQDGFLELALPYLEKIGYVERYSYFEPNGGFGTFMEDGELTSTGLIYRNQPTRPNQADNSLPLGWDARDIGSPSENGKCYYSEGIYTVCGGGDDIWGSSDNFHYASFVGEADGFITAKVESMVNTSDWAKAGLMVRQSLSSDSKHAMIACTAGQGASFQYREQQAGESDSVKDASGGSSGWLRLEKAGSLLTGYYSSNGSDWREVGSRTIDITGGFRAGLCVTAHNDSKLSDVIFSNVHSSWNKTVCDINSDLEISLADLSLFISEWLAGSSSETKTRCDFNMDSSVDMMDLSVFAENWK
ncbi:Beta-xylosidase [Sedimentisphaera cyanobacteriorum]|uniref:Beta-xylosidase n=1 Tax=Sedimentisphaera cyanobacteriorum TaxID=1940790 RepID=A0A1Q2HSM5_9BACT|nr:glycosyl hydrolase [Sedimentisphaera cyanobacteriorum]AQQ10370.1 Beta-xylosidase [Sedimentisphaera cyanobacteriorum]